MNYQGNTVELRKVKITSLEDGRELLAQIDAAINVAVLAMRAADNNADWQFASDSKYKLHKAKRNIQSQMATLVKERRK